MDCANISAIFFKKKMFFLIFLSKAVCKLHKKASDSGMESDAMWL